MTGGDWSKVGETGDPTERPALTVTRLLETGFVEIDCWLVGKDRLHPPRNLPTKRGVYAFAIDDRVMYVGLASRSVRQRLGFYARPGASQLTNVRLNGMIRDVVGEGHIVRILIGHPPDLEWAGLRVSGSEGLEAALIEDFTPPWNMKGANQKRQVAVPKSRVQSEGRRARGSVPQAVIDFVRQNPRCTEMQIAKGVFGPTAVQPQANGYCRKLVENGTLERLSTRPATYITR